MVIVKATKTSETGGPPDPEMMEAMGRFNTELLEAGILQDCDGLLPSSRGQRVARTAGGQKTVVNGPFPDTESLIAGFWIWKVKSMEEAVEWVRRCPDPMPGDDSEIEIRPFAEPEDLGPENEAKVRERRARMRSEVEKREG